MSADPIERGYDLVYDAWPNARTLHRIWREQVTGPAYPRGFEHISFASHDELRRLSGALALRPGDALADLACGAGGSGLWVARQTGARLTGIDLSSVGIARARARAAALHAHDARFFAGAFDRTGLPDQSMRAVMSLDALQYAPDTASALREVARILAPGGRFAFCAFVVDAARVAAVPGLWLDPVADYRAAIAVAGLRVVSYDSTPGWLERVSAAYSAVIAARADLVDEIGAPATDALLGEMILTLELRPYRDRIFAVSEKPAA